MDNGTTHATLSPQKEQTCSLVSSSSPNWVTILYYVNYVFVPIVIICILLQLYNDLYIRRKFNYAFLWVLAALSRQSIWIWSIDKNFSRSICEDGPSRRTAAGLLEVENRINNAQFVAHVVAATALLFIYGDLLPDRSTSGVALAICLLVMGTVGSAFILIGGCVQDQEMLHSFSYVTSSFNLTIDVLLWALALTALTSFRLSRLLDKGVAVLLCSGLW